MAFLKPSRNRLFAIIPAALLLILLAACDPSRPQSTFGPEGPVAARQLGLFWLIFWIAVVVFVLVQGALLYTVIRYRKRPGSVGLPPQTHGHRRLEIAWTIAPALVLVVIAIPTYMTIAWQGRAPSNQEPINVRVIGHQWWWEFQYYNREDLDRQEASQQRVGAGELSESQAYKASPFVVTANELHIPVDRPVRLTLHSGDVVHSFWVPKLGGKIDVFPSGDNHMWLQADKPGVYYGQCAELCGFAHAQMGFRVISEPKDIFDAWVRGQQAPPQQPIGLAATGSQLFATKGCLVCHSISGPEPAGVQEARMNGFLAGASLFPAPNLTSFALRGTLAGGQFDNNTQNLRKWLRDPDAMKPGNRMAELAAVYQDGASQLTDKEIDGLVAYLQSLKPDLEAPQATPTPIPITTAVPSKKPTSTVSSLTNATTSLQISSVENLLEFNKNHLTVKINGQVTVKLNNPSTALQHNWVLVRAGTEDSVAAAGTAAGPANGWTPNDDHNVIAHTALLDPGASGEVTFPVPPPGIYAFVCTFPGHGTTMRGVFEVTD